MAATAPILLRVTLPDIDGIAADSAVNQFAFASADVAACVTAVEAFYNTVFGTVAVAEYISGSRSRVANASLIQTYELAGFLHGEPHGSPIQTDTFTLAAPTGVDLADQLAIVLAYHGDLSALPEHGPTVARPVSEEAADEGAIGTFLAKTRPRASLRGRLYLGPLTQSAVSNTGAVDATCKTDISASAHALHIAVAGAWSVWSRTYGTVSPIQGGWIDDDFGVQRRRRDKTVTRTVWV